MGNGFDFTENEDEVLQEQRDAAKAAEEWQNLTEKSIMGELNGLNSRVTTCALLVQRMLADNDYQKAKDRLQALAQKDLGFDGWLSSFCFTNQSAFADYCNGTARPDWYNTLSAEEKKNYEADLKYYKEAGFLLSVASSVAGLIQMVPLEEGFRLMRIKGNFEEAGFDKELYKRMDEEIRSASVLLNLDWSELESRTRKSKTFIDSNISSMTRLELEKGYRAARLEDFKQIIRTSSLYNSLIEQPDGNYNVNPYILLLATVIDEYTFKVAQTPDLKDPMQKVINECQRIITGDIATAEKNCSSQSAQFLCEAFRTLCEAIQAFAQSGLETYVNFKEGKDESPYCFMKKLSCLSSAKAAFSFNPSMDDPWAAGTYLKDLYESAARSLGAQCRLFVYDHGATIVG